MHTFPNYEYGLDGFSEVTHGGWFDSATGAPLSERPAVSSRLPQFIGLTGSSETTLAGLSIAVVGAGSVGRTLAVHAARLDPKELRIVDHAACKTENLLTQSITPRDLGQPKAFNTAQLCQAVSRSTHVSFFDGKFQQLDLMALRSVDVVLLATDNLAAEVAVSSVCRRLGRPLIQASVFGDALVAQVRLVANRKQSAPCLACGFGPEEWKHYRRQSEFSCSGNSQSGGPTDETPTMSTSFLCSLAADLAMVQLLRYILNLGKGVSDSLMEYCGYTHATSVSPLIRNPKCPCDHGIWTQVEARRPVHELTLAELANDTRHFNIKSSAALSFHVGGYQFLDSAYCCGKLHPIRRFVRLGAAVGGCSQCGLPLRAARLFSRDGVASATLGPLLEARLDRLGAVEARWVAIHGLHHAVLASWGNH